LAVNWLVPNQVERLKQLVANQVERLKQLGGSESYLLDIAESRDHVVITIYFKTARCTANESMHLSLATNPAFDHLKFDRKTSKKQEDREPLKALASIILDEYLRDIDAAPEQLMQQTV
jgi:hypothetical protein